VVSQARNHTQHIPSTWENKAGGLHFQGLPGLQDQSPTPPKKDKTKQKSLLLTERANEGRVRGQQHHKLI
jgi:hypothetical protein